MSSVVRAIDGVFSDQTLGARERQEDAVGHRFFDSNGSVLVVLADGMGGHQGGEVASRTSVDTFINAFFSDFASLKTPYRLFGSLERANKELEAIGKRNTDLEGMGTTLIAAAMSAAGISWISVGDSLLLRVRGGKIQRLNEDHSMAPVLDEAVNKGALTLQQAASHQDRNALRSAVSGAVIELVDIADQPEPLRNGDVILLASDGLLTLTQDEIVRCVQEQRTAGARAIVSRLLETVSAKNKRRQDNTTIAAIVIERSSIHGSLSRRNSLRSWVIGTAFAAVFMLLGFGAGKGFPQITSITKFFSTLASEVEALALPKEEATEEGADEVQPVDITDPAAPKDDVSTEAPVVNPPNLRAVESVPPLNGAKEPLGLNSDQAANDESKAISASESESRPTSSVEKKSRGDAGMRPDPALESTELEVSDTYDASGQPRGDIGKEKIQQTSGAGIDDANAKYPLLESKYARPKGQHLDTAYLVNGAFIVTRR